MSDQLSFFDSFWQRFARRTDPETSKDAAKRVNEFTAKMYHRISSELENGDGTYEELASRMGAELGQLSKRLPEMQRLGIVELTGEVRYGKSGRKQRVWRKTK